VLSARGVTARKWIAAFTVSLPVFASLLGHAAWRAEEREGAVEDHAAVPRSNAGSICMIAYLRVFERN